MFDADAHARLRAYALCTPNHAYSKRMPTRGNAVEIPLWWMDALAVAIDTRKLKRTDLAAFLIGDVAAGAARDRAMNAARVKVTRFFDHGIHTSEIVAVWCKALNLPPFEFTADTRKQAEAMALAKRDPDLLTRIMAAGQLVVEIESGEHRLDDLLSARQTGGVESPDGAVRRGSRGRVPISSPARSERR